MQSLRAPGGVPVLRIMLQVQMVTPHLVHVLSQSPGTVPMRQRGDRYVWSIFLRESAKINQFQPNVRFMHTLEPSTEELHAGFLSSLPEILEYRARGKTQIPRMVF